MVTVTVTRHDSKGPVHKKYELTDEFKAHIEELAENRFDDNDCLDMWWEEDEPILNIYTKGRTMPWEYIDQMKDMEMEEGEQSGEDTAYVYFPEKKQYLPVVEDEENEQTMPEEVQDEPDEAAYVYVQKDDNTTAGSWDVGRAMLPREDTYQWNVQERIDEAKRTNDLDSGYSDEWGEQKRLHTRLDTWESMLVTFGCEYETERPDQGTKASDRVKRQKRSKNASNGERGARWI